MNATQDSSKTPLPADWEARATTAWMRICERQAHVFEQPGRIQDMGNGVVELNNVRGTMARLRWNGRYFADSRD